VSFTNNPFKHMIVLTDEDGVTFQWECESCGGTGGSFHPDTPVSTVRGLFLIHIQRSHARTKADFEGWS
jgi:hypothetical protein